MARLASVAVGGYYPTPAHLLPCITSLLESDGEYGPSILDPCCGSGGALHFLREKFDGARIYGCEMEKTRWKAGKELLGIGGWGRSDFLHGDAFRATWEQDGHYARKGISLLFLNPPYDTDPVHGRLEHKFLQRFTAAVKENGILVFLVPFYALKASASFLAQNYVDLRCYKFPDEDFKAYKQVVLYAKRRPELSSPNPTLKEQVLTWVENVKSIPALPKQGEVTYTLPTDPYYEEGLRDWRIRPVDITAIAKKVKVWYATDKSGKTSSVSGVLPDLPVADLLLRKYPVATPPRPAHIASGIAAGVFNGARIEPTDRKKKLPPLLVKGVFDREYRTVEEKRNKDGMLSSVVQVQQPKLVTTVLDLKTHKYHTLTAGAEETKGTSKVEDFTVADILKHYGPSLMGAMERQCPVLYDSRKDGGSIPLPESPRKLFTAQSHAAKALVKLLGGTGSNVDRRGKAVILLGEIGSGKTGVSLVSARTTGSVRPLVMCPPHLLDSWKNEVAIVFPEASVRVLSTVTDVQDFAADGSDGLVIGLLSREPAKLSHGWRGVQSVCPRCGSPVPPGDLGKKRARCKNHPAKYKSPLRQRAHALALRMAKYDPKNGNLDSMLYERMPARFLQYYRDQSKDPPAYPGFQAGELDDVIEMLLTRFKSKPSRSLLVLALLLAGSQDCIRRIAIKVQAKEEGFYYGPLSLGLLLLLPEEQRRELESEWRNPLDYSDYAWNEFDRRVQELDRGNTVAIGDIRVKRENGRYYVDGQDVNTARFVIDTFLRPLMLESTPRFGSECGEPLFQAVPEPRRVALAQYITHRFPKAFDFLILDECHEYANEGTAQERSAHRLTSLGLPTILMTGSIMNGYAESLFTNMWALSAEFRKEFSRDERSLFNERYGYRKRVLQDKDSDGEVIEFGSMSDRAIRSERIAGNAPGVLPLFLLRHLLPISVTLHKADLAIDLPPCKQERVGVDADPDVLDKYRKLQGVLLSRIRQDQFKPDVAGRLFGQLAELPSFLDRATVDTGNVGSDHFEIRYPESLKSELVAKQELLPASRLLSKEKWLVERVQSELMEGRNVMVFSWHLNVLPRLSRLIEEVTGEKAPILYANKVATAKRQAWITREIVKKKRRVMLANPVAIQTGLNNLVHFSTEIWMENPACNPVTYRQATGRVDRIGQTKETRIVFPVYRDTLQEQMLDLLMHKVAVSVSTDGLDPETALQAAGVGTEDNFLAGLSIGKQLWAMLQDEFELAEAS